MARPEWAPKAGEDAIKEIEQKMKELEQRKKMLLHVRYTRQTISDKPVQFYTKEEKIQALDQLPQLDTSLYEVLNGAGFLTGSLLYGDKANAADEDWVVNVPPHVFEGYALGTEDDGYWETDGMSTIYAHRNGKTINIICVSDPLLFRAWFRTTEVMKELVDMPIFGNRWTDEKEPHLKEVFMNKYNRVRVFRALKDVFYPVEQWQNKEPLPKKEALEHHKCRVCRQEAINFSCKKERLKYEATGVCERCTRY